MRQSLQLNNSSLIHNQNVSFSTLSFEKKRPLTYVKGSRPLLNWVNLREGTHVICTILEYYNSIQFIVVFAK